MLSMGGSRWLGDASFWLDEASVAYNVLSMDAHGLFGPLDTGHQFPRVYLAVINQLRLVFGYETMVLRALPFACFVAGVALWHRLLWRRFAAAPALVLLGCVLCLVPGDWFAYGAMFKQYSLDVLVALLPFTLTDAELERRWRSGHTPARLLWWMLPCLVSLSYGIALLGRATGYWLGTARTRGPRLPLASTAILVAGFAAAMGASYAIDLRHAFQNEAAYGFWQWQGCIPSGDPVADAGLVGRWCVDWLIGRNAFGGDQPVPMAVVAVLGACALTGAVRLLLAAWQGSASMDHASAVDPNDPHASEAADRAAWGTRSLSALATIGGLFAAALLFGLPLCANRLTLFAFFSLVLVALEGVSTWIDLARRHRPDARWLELAPLALALLVAPSASSTVGTLLRVDAPENLRPILPLIEAAPERPIVVGRCSGMQGLTLPEWLGRDDVFYVDEHVRAGEPDLPAAREFWLVTAGGYVRCPGWTNRIRATAEVFRPVTDRSHTATLHLVRMPARADESP